MHYAKIRNLDIANGEGVRVSLFVSGCKFHCKGCFNQEQQDFNYGEKYTKKTEDYIIKLLNNPYVDGLSILGGDPLWQDDMDILTLCDLCDRVHDLGKTVWTWSGFTIEDIFKQTTRNCAKQFLILKSDVFVDGQFDLNKADRVLKWKGSSNQRVIDIAETVSQNKIILRE